MLVYLKCCSFVLAVIYYLGEQRCDTIPYPSNALEVLMFVRNESHINDVTAFIALMSEKAVVINHKKDGSWFAYPGCYQAEGTYAFCGEADDYESLIKMLKSCGKDVTIIVG